MPSSLKNYTTIFDYREIVLISTFSILNAYATIVFWDTNNTHDWMLRLEVLKLWRRGVFDTVKTMLYRLVYR
jgi:hypothetical protein